METQISSERMIVIDGSNVIRYSRYGRKPGIENLKLVLEELTKRGYKKFHVFVDYRTYKRFGPEKIQEIVRRFGGKVEPAVGVPADDFILDKASTFDALILSNDRFETERLLRGKSVEERRVGFAIYTDEKGTRVLLDFPDMRWGKIPPTEDIEKFFLNLTSSDLEELAKRTLREYMKAETESVREEFIKGLRQASNQELQKFQSEIDHTIIEEREKIKEKLWQEIETKEELRKSLEDKIVVTCREKLLKELRPKMLEEARGLFDRLNFNDLVARVQNPIMESVLEHARPVIEKESKAQVRATFEEMCRSEEVKNIITQAIENLFKSDEVRHQLLEPVAKDAIYKTAKKLTISDAPQLREEIHREVERFARRELEAIARKAARKAVAEEWQRLLTEERELRKKSKELGDEIQNLRKLLIEEEERLGKRLEKELDNRIEKVIEALKDCIKRPFEQTEQKTCEQLETPS
jgi:hypothetical protein